MPIFRIEVTRIGYASRVIEVEATTQDDAERIALETAGNHEFTEHYAEYQLTGGPCPDPNKHPSTTQKGGAYAQTRPDPHHLQRRSKR